MECSAQGSFGSLEEVRVASNAKNFSNLAATSSLGWINSETPRQTIINFFSLDRRRSRIVETYAYLYEASIREIDVTCDRSFPDLISIDEENHAENSEEARHSVSLVFQDGRISFFYREVHFHTVERTTTIVGDE